MAYGWISIHRKIQDNWLWEEKPFSKGQAWIDMLLLANHENNKILFNGTLTEVKSGERITSLRKLGDRWGWSMNKVKRFLKLLESDHMIELKMAHQMTSYKIVNYNVYQDHEYDERHTDGTQKEHQRNTNETPTEQRRNTNGTPTETNNNDNNDNNDNNENNENKYNPGGLSEPKLDNPQLAKLIKIYEGAGFGMINPYAAKILEDYLGEYGYEWVKEAIEIASEKGVRNLSYINGILKNMRSGKSQAKKKRKKLSEKVKVLQAC